MSDICYRYEYFRAPLLWDDQLNMMNSIGAKGYRVVQLLDRGNDGFFLVEIPYQPNVERG